MSKNVKKPVSSIVKESATAYRNKSNPLYKAHGSTNKQDKKAEKDVTTGERKPSVLKLSEPEKNDDAILIRWLGGTLLVPHPINSHFDLFHAGSEGIPKASVDELATHLGISRKSMAEDIFDLSVKTLERKAPGDKLDRRTSSHALEIARVMQHGFDVFEDEEKLKRWINKENRALNGLKPVALFATLTGLNMVNDILGRVEEGVYS